MAGDAPVHQLSLHFARDRFQIRRQDPPWKIVRAFAVPRSGALVHLNNVSGGVLAGDRLALDVELEPGAAAQITTTGATRLYRHRAGADDSEQRVRFSVGDSAQLEYLPDPVIPYAGSRHRLHTDIRLGAGATMFWWDVLAPGRLAAGERFAFERLHVQTEARAGTRPILRENFLLEPARKHLPATARMFEYSHLASFCALSEGRPPELWRKLEEQLNQLARDLTRPSEALWGASALASDGVVVRGLAASGRFIYDALIRFWMAARLEITGEPAVPPRKTY